MKRILVALAALSVSALTWAQSTPPSHDSTASANAQVSPSADRKPAPASKPEVAGKVELRDVKPQASPSASSLVLKDSGPVSTEDVARGVAKELAAQDTSGTKEQTAGPSSTQAQNGNGSAAKTATHSQSLGQQPTEATDAVAEFQPAPPGSGAASSSDVVLKGARSKSSRVHGDLYGVAGDAGRAAGGSVGGTSKSGKTSVYVESDAARSKSDQPQ